MDFGGEFSVLQGGAAAVLVGVLIAIFRGLIVPRRTVMALQEVYEARLREKNEEAARWRTAWEVSQQAHGLKDSQLGELLELARVSAASLEALRKVGGE